MIAFAVGAFAIAGPITQREAAPSVGGSAVPAPSVTPSAAASGELTAASLGTGVQKTDGKAAARASGPSKFTDERATAYFQARWKDGVVKRVRDIRTTGGYLRIYTDLPETAGNSKTAITLCKRGLEYLTEQGESNPVVFVQAKFGENGNPVLANVLGPDDRDCRVTHPKPR